MIGSGIGVLAVISPEASLAVFGAVISCAITIVGAGAGIGWIGSKGGRVCCPAA